MVRLSLFLLLLVASLLHSCNEPGSKESGTSSDTLKQRNAEADTVNNPRVVLPDDNGELLLTAEKGKAAGPEIKYMPEWRAFGWFTAADSVMWDINIQMPGKYDVFLEWSVSDEEAGKIFLLRSGEQQITGTVEKSGSWETFKTKKIGELDFPAGPQQLLFKSQTQFAEGGLLDLRQIKLVRREK